MIPALLTGWSPGCETACCIFCHAYPCARHECCFLHTCDPRHIFHCQPRSTVSRDYLLLGQDKTSRYVKQVVVTGISLIGDLYSWTSTDCITAAVVNPNLLRPKGEPSSCVDQSE